jgi:hypothetical protein
LPDNDVASVACCLIYNETITVQNLRQIRTKRQATQHGCLPSLLGDGDKEIEKVKGKEINIL